jgi:hypothetical protein
MKKFLLLTALSISVYGKAQTCAGVIFTSGPNALGTGGGYNTYQQNCLSYNADLNTVLWTHRASPYWNFPHYTSGCIQSTWLNVSTNHWDSMIIYRDSTTNHARYPGGTIFNPTGNTNIANALMVGTGPTNNGTNWSGAWYSSRQPTGSYHTVTSAQNDNAVCLSGQAPFGNMGSSNGDGGPNADIQQVGNTIFVGGSLVNYSYTQTDAIPFKGGLIGKATYSGGNLTWSADSIIPNFYAGTLGYLNHGTARIAFSPNGQIGYVVFIGRLATNYGNASADSALTPIVYKSTNGGATWSSTSILPGFNWVQGHPEMLKNVGYLYPYPTTNFMPYAQHGIDVTVDSIGTLHLVTTVSNANHFVTGNIDSLASYSTSQYNWDYKKHHPIIWDMMTDGTTWNTILVDSIKTSFMSDGVIYSDTSLSSNPWAGVTLLPYGARIQVSRSVTGGKIFYSWADSDSSQTHTLYNTNPDIYMKSYDISNQLVTPTSNVTTGLGQCYFHYLSDISYYDTNIGGYVCPLVYTTDIHTTPPFNSGDTVHYNYLNCAKFYTTQYNTAASVYRTQSPSGIANYTNNTQLKIYPNPANNKITIDATDVVDIKLFDVLGKQIFATKTTEVDVSNFNDGVYFIQVQTKQNTTTQKIMVQH